MGRQVDRPDPSSAHTHIVIRAEVLEEREGGEEDAVGTVRG